MGVRAINECEHFKHKNQISEKDENFVTFNCGVYVTKVTVCPRMFL